jgi:hypothetical protein
MGLFKKKQHTVAAELKCPVEGCSFKCDDNVTLKKHVDWAHPQLTQNKAK